MAKRKNYALGHSKKRSARPLFIISIMLLVCVGIIASVVLFNTRQTLDGEKVVKTSYTTSAGVEAVDVKETQRYYSLRVRRPDFEKKTLPSSLSDWFTAEESDYRGLLEGLLDAKTLTKKDPAKLSLDFATEAFDGYTTYTVTSDRYICADSSDNRKTTRTFIVGDSDGTELTAAALFKDSDGYVSLLNSKASANYGGDSAETLSAAITDYEGALALTSDGLKVTYYSAVGDSVPAGSSFTVDYKTLYKLVTIALPDEYKPAEPTPIDPSAEKVVALTFDDGPHGTWTPKLLELLKQYNAKATFFVVGYNVDYHPDVIKQIVADGNEIAIHSTDHVSLKKESDSEILADINGMEDKIYSVCGVRPYIVRPVGGAVTQAIADVLQRPCIIWDVDPEDWKYRDADHVYNEVINNVRSGDIVLSHDIYKSTYEAYVRIIPELAAQGYRFVTVSELLGIDGLENTDAYAAKIVFYRSLSRELRQAGSFSAVN